MKKIIINGVLESSQILIGESINNFRKYLPDKKIIIVTDKNLNRLYGSHFNQFPVIEIGTGENSKTLKTIEFIISKLIELQFDRHSFVVGIGGGIVCDVTGFAASVFMRGIDFGFISTTLLSQVDASIGGKNGVNFNSYKNIIGNFNQPEFVICDPEMLKTLPPKEVKCGMGEIVKHSLIADKNMFGFINENYSKILSLDNGIITKLVYTNVRIKAEIVNKDEKEKGERKKLNFGHTLAHAIEKYSDLSHGEAVAIGILFAANLSYKKSYLSKSEFLQIEDLLKKLNLPIKINIDSTKLTEAITKDKKRYNANIDFVYLKKIGDAFVQKIGIDELSKAIIETE